MSIPEPVKELRPHVVWDAIKELAREGIKMMLPFLVGLGITKWVHEHSVELMWTGAIVMATLIAFSDRKSRRVSANNQPAMVLDDPSDNRDHWMRAAVLRDEKVNGLNKQLEDKGKTLDKLTEAMRLLGDKLTASENEKDRLNQHIKDLIGKQLQAHETETVARPEITLTIDDVIFTPAEEPGLEDQNSGPFRRLFMTAIFSLLNAGKETTANIGGLSVGLGGYVQGAQLVSISGRSYIDGHPWKPSDLQEISHNMVLPTGHRVTRFVIFDASLKASYIESLEEVGMCTLTLISDSLDPSSRVLKAEKHLTPPQPTNEPTTRRSPESTTNEN
jgi:uncharacterized coiled-coil protein SlyX